MNCYICGEEIKSGVRHGFVCQACLDAETEKKLKFDGESINDERGENEMPLSAETAIRLMLDGEILVRQNGILEKWDGHNFRFRYPSSDEWETGLSSSHFVPLFYQPKTRPMDTFECIAWAASDKSLGWVVSSKYVGNDFWEDWRVPQWFKYDGKEGYGDHGVVSYRRAKVLPDNSGIDESTIQGFLMEVKRPPFKVVTMPRYETPQQYEKRTGRPYSDEMPVWWTHIVSAGREPGWILSTYAEAKKEIENAGGYSNVLVIVVCVYPPPVSWRPE